MDFSILIPTYNRSEVLRETLEAMTHVDREGISVEFVVIDNNSTDNTREVVESFADRLPVQYLFQARPGKSCAVNLALDSIELGHIVVFADDDVTPCGNWLPAIKATCRRWANHSVFGGKITLGWPELTVPPWARVVGRRGWVYAAHDRGDQERLYDPGGYPYGPNFWVRSEVLRDGRRFDETVGPGTSRIVGDETRFLEQLAEDGYQIVYSPDAVVSHRIRPEQLTVAFIRQRARGQGRSAAHANARHHCEAFRKHPIIWRLVRLLARAKWRLLYVLAMLSFSADKRIIRSVEPIRILAGNLEVMRIVRQVGKPQPG